MSARFLPVLFVALTAALSAQSPAGAMTNDHWDFIGVNRLLMWMGNNGGMAHDPVTSGPGLEWPRGSGRHLAFAQGLVFGGWSDALPRVGGATYRYGWQAGPILPDGSAADPSDPANRVYRVRRFDAADWPMLPQAERALFLRDLAEWPVWQGAPWTDNNGNGVYDPDTAVFLQGGPTDVPEWRGDEMLWFVANDLDFERARALYGLGPVGMQLSTLAWASAGHPLLENVVFLEHTLVHRGLFEITDMKIGMWEDADLGDPFDDACGIDTQLRMAFSWNGIRNDNVYGLPPASGTVWLQTPVEESRDSVAWYGSERRQGYRNTPMTSFQHFIGGSSIYRDAQIGVSSSGATMLLHQLSGKGWDGRTFTDPSNGWPTPYLLSGDPVLDKGWVDGVTNAPGDRRYLSAAGGFGLAPGDTQKVTTARVAVAADHRLLAVRELRKAARQLQDIYTNLPVGARAPVFTSDLRHTTGGGFYEVRVTGGPFPAGTTGAIAVLRAPDGAELQRFQMRDDGQHSDAVAGDGVYSAAFPGFGKSTGADLYVLTTEASGEKEWFVGERLPLPGPVSVRLTDLVLDSPSSDGRAQPGEYLRFRLRVENATTQEMGPWHLFLRGEQGLTADREVQRIGGRIAPGEAFEPEYDPASADSYIGIDLPAGTPPGLYVIPTTLISEQHCAWDVDLYFAVDSLPVPTAHGLLKHVQGLASGSLGYTILDPSALTGHDYRVSIEGEDFGAKTMHVEDVTLGTTLYRGIPVPDSFSPFSPEIDGWAVTIGTACDELVYDDQGLRLESFVNDYAASFSEPSRAWFNLYDNRILLAGEEYFPSLSTQYDLMPVRLVFDRTNGQKAPMYLRGAAPNYAFTGSFDIPVRAYDISDSAKPRQLMLAFGEQRNRPGCDSSFMPTSDVLDREFLMVYSDDYAEQPDAKFLQPLDPRNATLPLLYLVWPLRDTTAALFEDGDSYTITPRVPVSHRDVYITPRGGILDVESTPTHPATVALHAPYPNPARGRCVITFDTHAVGTVSLTVHDMLGRRVARLVDRHLDAGTHQATFNTASLRSGTYRIVLVSSDQRSSRTLTVLR